MRMRGRQIKIASRKLKATKRRVMQIVPDFSHANVMFAMLTLTHDRASPRWPRCVPDM